MRQFGTFRECRKTIFFFCRSLPYFYEKVPLFVCSSMFIYWFTKLSLKKTILYNFPPNCTILKPSTLWLFLVTHPLLPAVWLINCVDFSIFETIKIQNGKRQEFVFQCLWNSIRIIRNVIYLFLLHAHHSFKMYVLRVGQQKMF